MKYLIVFATMVVCCIAMPALQDRPTPINPSVVIEPKPTEKPTPVKNEKDDEIPQPFYPTALPAEVSHHLSKRDHKPGQDSHPVAKPQVPEPLKKTPASTSPVKANVKPHAPPSPISASVKPHAVPSSAIKVSEQKRNRRDVQQVDNAKIELQKPQTLPALISDNDHNDASKQVGAVHGNHASNIGFQKPQILPATLHENEKHKRDAPVPLVATHEQTSNVEQKPKETNDKKEEEKAKEPSHNSNVQVEDLSGHQSASHHTLSTSKLPQEFHPHRDHRHPTTDEQKPVTLGDIQQKPNTNKVVGENTTEHPLIRPKPVPVSELFKRN